MIGGLLTGFAASPWMRAALPYAAIVIAEMLSDYAVMREQARACGSLSIPR